MFSREGEQCLTLVEGLFAEFRVQTIEDISAEVDHSFESNGRRFKQGTLSKEEKCGRTWKIPNRGWMTEEKRCS